MVDTIGGFSPFSYKHNDSSVTRYLFVKQHEGDDEVKPSDRTLYILNIPQYFTENCLRLLFKAFGNIEKVYLHDKPTSGEGRKSEGDYFIDRKLDVGSQVGYIVYRKQNGVEKSLKSQKCMKLPASEFNAGKRRFIGEYNSQLVSAEGLQKDIDDFMSRFDAEREKSLLASKEATDEEGWTVVSHTKLRPRTEAANTKAQERQRRAEKKMALVKFYKSQLKDAKMDQILELRKKFEKDKARIAQMRASRKFKPF